MTDRVNERRSRQPAGQIIEQSRTARGPVSVSGIGAHLIRVIIDNDDVQAFQDLTPELFIDDDRRAYEFAVQHYRRHGQLPTTVTLGFNGYRLPEPGDKEPVSYYVEQCQQRAIYNACNRAHGQVLDALRVRDTDGAARIFAETNDRLNELQSRFRNVSEGSNAVELLARDLPPIRWAVPSIIPDGLSLMAGKPKLFKSYLCLDLLNAVATGTATLGKNCEEGDALYVCCEGGEVLLQQRLREVTEGQTSERLEYWLNCPPLREGGLGKIEQWLRDHPEARLVVIDTLGHVRKRSRSGTFSYWEDVAELKPLCDLAYRHRVGILVVHHCKKDSTQDPMDEISGSNGLSGTPDQVIVMRRDLRDERLIYMHKRGRLGGAESEIAMRWNSDRYHFDVLGDADQYRRSDMQRRILEVLEEAGNTDEPWMSAQEIADAGEFNKVSSVRTQLYRLKKENSVSKCGRQDQWCHASFQSEAEGAGNDEEIDSEAT